VGACERGAPLEYVSITAQKHYLGHRKTIYYGAGLVASFAAQRGPGGSPTRTATGPIGELVTRIDDIVLALEDRRISSMISGDIEALAALISPACCYVHSSGDFDTGRAYLDKVRNGVFGYEAADIDERSVVVSAANVATIVFRMRATVRVGTVRRQTFDLCTAVWTDRDTAFQLVAFQATPLVPSQPLPGALSRECCPRPGIVGRH
jgi:hypothetical protein